MKVAILADVHGNMVALKKVLDDISNVGVDEFIVLGDIVMVGPEPMLVFENIQKLDPIAWIKGNTDMWFGEMSDGWTPQSSKEKELFSYYRYASDNLSLEYIHYLLKLPVTQSIQLAQRSILCVHGSPRNVVEIMDGRIPHIELAEMISGIKESIVLCGHSHVPYIGEVNGKIIFNVGSVGRSLDGDSRASYGIIDFSSIPTPQFEIRRVPYSVEDLLSIAEKNNFPNLEKYSDSILKAAFVG